MECVEVTESVLNSSQHVDRRRRWRRRPRRLRWRKRRPTLASPGRLFRIEAELGEALDTSLRLNLSYSTGQRAHPARFARLVVDGGRRRSRGLCRVGVDRDRRHHGRILQPELHHDLKGALRFKKLSGAKSAAENLVWGSGGSWLGKVCSCKLNVGSRSGSVNMNVKCEPVGRDSRA